MVTFPNVRNVSPYSGSKVYSTSSISFRPDPGRETFANQLLLEKHGMIEKFGPCQTMLDVGCATGVTLEALSHLSQQSIGVDLTPEYLAVAIHNAGQLGTNSMYVLGNATSLPLADASVDVAYSLATLYVVPNFRQAINEIARVLKPDGFCLLDLGNSNSLNGFCMRYYRELIPLNGISYSELRTCLVDSGLTVETWRTFQLLPLWAGRPRWMWPLLHPLWQKAMVKRIRGKMIDEWVCSLPVLRRFAFRHLVACRKSVPESV